MPKANANKKASNSESPTAQAKTNSPSRRKSEDSSRLGKRSATLKTKNYREQESDTESIFGETNLSPRSLKVPYRPKGFVLQQALQLANSSNKNGSAKGDRKKVKGGQPDKIKSNPKIKKSTIKTRTGKPSRR